MIDFLDVLLQNGDNRVQTGSLPVVVDDLTLVCPGSNLGRVDLLLAGADGGGLLGGRSGVGVRDDGWVGQIFGGV